MRSYKYKKIDAFTSENSLGNPAACIYMEGEELTPDEMLYAGQQHKGFVSEVVFGQKSDKADIKLTYFSSECEVEFCGHGTIATMYDFVKNNPDLKNKDEILMETNRKGILKVYNRLEKEDAVFITAPEPEYLSLSLKKKEIAEALEIGETLIADDYSIEFINAGLRTLLVPIKKLADEISMYPNEQKLKNFCLKNHIDIILVFCFETSTLENFIHTRVFAPKFGYLEDPATGSGNSALGYYMKKNSLWNGEPIAIEQGGDNRVYNLVKLLLKDNKVLFGGSAKTRIDGVYHIE